METVPEKPASVAALQDCVRAAAAGGTPLAVSGAGSKRGLGHAGTGTPVSLASLAGILDYDPDEMVLTVGAGTPLADVVAALHERRQMLGFEPCTIEALWSGSEKPTIGGTIAAAIAGPRRFALGGPRDHLLGFRAVDGRGEVFAAGGRVVKNVTGYDLPKLAAGSFGTLFLMTELTLRVYPQPLATHVLCVEGLPVPESLACLRTLARSPLEPSALAYIPARDGNPSRMLCRFEGEAQGARERVDAAARSIPYPGRITGNDEAMALIRPLIEVAGAFQPDSALWRASLPPAAASAFLDDAKPAHVLVDAAGAVIWLADPAVDLHAVAAHHGGHAMLCRRGRGAGTPEHVFQPPDMATMALLARLKDAFDPARILNPGRMYTEI
jgi:glycolate oxidase FAD binding subunit